MGIVRTVAKNSFFNLIATFSDVVINLFCGERKDVKFGQRFI